MSPGSSLFRQLRYDGILVFHDPLKRGGDGRRHGEGRPNVAKLEAAARGRRGLAGCRVGEIDGFNSLLDVQDRAVQHARDGILRRFMGVWPDAPEKKVL